MKSRIIKQRKITSSTSDTKGDNSIAHTTSPELVNKILDKDDNLLKKLYELRDQLSDSNKQTLKALLTEGPIPLMDKKINTLKTISGRINQIFSSDKDDDESSIITDLHNQSREERATYEALQSQFYDKCTVFLYNAQQLESQKHLLGRVDEARRILEKAKITEQFKEVKGIETLNSNIKDIRELVAKIDSQPDGKSNSEKIQIDLERQINLNKLAAKILDIENQLDILQTIQMTMKKSEEIKLSDKEKATLKQALKSFSVSEILTKVKTMPSKRQQLIKTVELVLTSGTPSIQSVLPKPKVGMFQSKPKDKSAFEQIRESMMREIDKLAPEHKGIQFEP